MGTKTRPVILVLDKITSKLNFLPQNVADDEPLHSIEYSSEMPDDDHHAYLVFKLLKAIENDDQLDEGVEEKFESMKDSIRQTPLRARCQKLNDCIEECPRKKPKCPNKCPQKYDDWGACGEEKKKKSKCDARAPPRCGKTMPPKWLLIVGN